MLLTVWYVLNRVKLFYFKFLELVLSLDGIVFTFIKCLLGLFVRIIILEILYLGIWKSGGKEQLLHLC